MHHGYLVAETTPDRLIEALGTCAGDLTAGAPATRFEDLDLGSDDAGWTLTVGERDGRAYLLDAAFLLSDDPDVVVAMSVAACWYRRVRHSNGTNDDLRTRAAPARSRPVGGRARGRP